MRRVRVVKIHNVLHTLNPFNLENNIMENISLTSTIVVPSFNHASMRIIALTKEQFLALLPQVTQNYCGHPLTMAVLKSECPSLPDKNGQFWDGQGTAIAARPKGGVRNAASVGDTEVTIDDLEFCKFDYFPQPWSV
jgi:hypothetical protein